MRKTSVRWILLLVIAGLTWLSYSAFRAAGDRVTLDVQNEELAKIIRSIERQTRETILVQPGTTNRVTLHVRDVPLEEVLEMISQQVSARWFSVYAIYSSRSTLKELEGIIAKGEPSQISRWTNYTSRPAPSPAMQFASNTGATADSVTLAVQKKTVPEIARELGRYGRTLVVPEDGLSGSFEFAVSGKPLSEAVSEFAKKLNRKWTKLYVLRPHFRGPRPKLPPPDPSQLGQHLTPHGGPGPFRISIPLGGGPGQLGLPPRDELLPPSGELPDPAAVQAEMQKKMSESLRNSSPQQRVERYRTMRQLPPPPAIP